MSLKEQFIAFSKFGDTSSDGKSITLKNVDKWLKQANVFDKVLTTTDTGIEFSKFKVKQLSQDQFEKFINNLATAKKMDGKTIIDKLVKCGPPGTTNTTQGVHVGGVDRLTDTTQYTGMHKERFDASGKGRGIEGREDIAQNDGYVQGYKNKGTYDKTHPK